MKSSFIIFLVFFLREIPLYNIEIKAFKRFQNCIRLLLFLKGEMRSNKFESFSRRKLPSSVESILQIMADRTYYSVFYIGTLRLKIEWKSVIIQGMDIFHQPKARNSRELNANISMTNTDSWRAFVTENKYLRHKRPVFFFDIKLNITIALSFNGVPTDFTNKQLISHCNSNDKFIQKAMIRPEKLLHKKQEINKGARLFHFNPSVVDSNAEKRINLIAT